MKNIIKKIILYPIRFFNRKRLFILRGRVNNHFKKLNNYHPYKSNNIFLAEGFYDTPNHYLRLKIFLLSLKFLQKRITPLGILFNNSQSHAFETLKNLGFQKIMFLDNVESDKKIEEMYDNFIKKIKTEKDILSIKFISKIPSYVFYDSALHTLKQPFLDLKLNNWKKELKKFLLIEKFYLNLFENKKIDFVVYSHPWKSYYAIPVWIAISKNIPAFYIKSENQTLRVKKMLDIKDFKTPFESLRYSVFKRLKEPLQKKIIELGYKHFETRIQGLSKDLNAKRAFYKKKIDTKTEFRNKLKIRNDNPIVIIFAHAWYDFPHCLNMKNFINFFDWITLTNSIIKNIKNINWVFKSHPLESWYGEPKLKDIIEVNHKNIFCLDERISTLSSLINSDYIVTVFGTVGLEATIMGKPALICDYSYYKDWRIGNYAIDRDDYIKKLKKIKSLNKPNKLQRDLAVAFMYFAFAPHDEKKGLLNFYDDYDTINVHKNALNFTFKKDTKEYNEAKLLSQWIKSNSRDYSAYVKLIDMKKNFKNEETRLFVKKIDINDKNDIFSWRNDLVTVKMSLSTRKVRWEEHVKWFQGLLNENKSIAFVGLIDDAKIGMVRFDFQKQFKTFVSINLNPEWRGKSLSSILLKKSINVFLNKKPK